MDLISLSPPYIPDRWARRMDFQCRLMRRSSVKGKKFITLWGKKSYRDDQRKIIVSKNKRLIEKERCNETGINSLKKVENFERIFDATIISSRWKRNYWNNLWKTSSIVKFFLSLLKDPELVNEGSWKVTFNVFICSTRCYILYYSIKCTR